MICHIEHRNGLYLDDLDRSFLGAIFHGQLHRLRFQAVLDRLLGASVWDFDNVNLSGDLRTRQ